MTDEPDAPRSADDFMAGSVVGGESLARVREVLASSHLDVTERTTVSQVAMRRRRVFALLWRPRQYLGDGAAELVLSLALPYRLESPRFKEIVHPAPTTWMHHLEVAAVDDLDPDVVGWLREAADAAG